MTGVLFKPCGGKGCRGGKRHLPLLRQKGWILIKAVHDHLQASYGDNKPSPFPYQDVQRDQVFTMEELQNALAKGGRCKAVGADQVSHELLLEIGKDKVGATEMLAWFNRLLHGEEEIPEDWDKVVMIIIPKISLPKLPKDLRPICLGSAASKLFSCMEAVQQDGGRAVYLMGIFNGRHAIRHQTRSSRIPAYVCGGD